MITRARETVPETLGAWAERLGGSLEQGDPDARVTGLADDSRQVEAGCLFFARRGALADGRDWVGDACARGAIATVVDRDADLAGLPCLRVANVDAARLEAADLFYGRPQDALDLIAVTGTKGKTTTAWVAAAALRYAGVPTALLGTIAHEVGPGLTEPARNTTPGVLEIRRLLATARDQGCRAAVMEVSSHALDQGRVAGLNFRSGVFTNLGHDHLDYHLDLETYFRTKQRLFSGLTPGATAVLNREDERWGRIAAGCRGRVLTYGFEPEADLRAQGVHTDITQTTFRLVIGGEREVDVFTTLTGRHNVLNILAAIGAVTALGVDPVDAARGAASLDGVPGRLQRVHPAGDLHAFVDYAHTPEALEQMLSFLRSSGAGELVCVVGCGGDRDRSKRPLMAHAAATRCARTWLTSDNPRSEDPDAILRDMQAGVPAESKSRVRTVTDRRAAIERAVHEAPPGACIVVAGKGHETIQIIGKRRIHFDDAEVLREALGRRSRALEGSEAPGLPRDS
jgi:UDP-N-acetylmuramyl-tripeptide synthetase